MTTPAIHELTVTSNTDMNQMLKAARLLGLLATVEERPAIPTTLSLMVNSADSIGIETHEPTVYILRLHRRCDAPELTFVTPTVGAVRADVPAEPDHLFAPVDEGGECAVCGGPETEPHIPEPASADNIKANSPHPFTMANDREGRQRCATCGYSEFDTLHVQWGEAERSAKAIAEAGARERDAARKEARNAGAQ